MAVGLVLLFFFAPIARDSFALLPPNVPKFAQLNNKPCPLYPLPVPLSIEDLQPSIDLVVKNISSALNAGTVRARGSVSVGLVIDQKLIWSKGFGYINESAPEKGPPTEHTGYRIASISKVFTDLMMYQLRDLGILPSLDDDITKYDHQFSVVNPFGKTKRGITFRQLSSHMSGLPRNPPCLGLFVSGCNASAGQIYKDIANFRLLSPPGTRPSYSNLGIGLLGRVLEKVTNPPQVWEDYIEKEVLVPLGMKDSGTRMPPKASTTMAVGYHPEGSVAKYIDIGWDAPAGNMYSSVHDLAQLMMMIFRSDAEYDPAKNQVLDGETIREWMHPAYFFSDSFGYGHPWELLPWGNYSLVTKDGAINGYLSEFRFSPQIKTGIIFLHSWEDETVHETVATYATNLITAVSEVLWSKQPEPTLPPNPQDYVGNYTSQGPGSADTAVVLYEDNQELRLALSGYVGKLRYTGKENNMQTFQLMLMSMQEACRPLSTGYEGMWVYFDEDPSSGRIDSFQIPGMNYKIIYKKMT